MGHIRGIGLENFRVFGSFEKEHFLEFKGITVLTGQNNSGKSGIIKALLLLKSGIKPAKSVFDLNELDFSKDEIHRLGNFEKALHNKAGEEDMMSFYLPISVTSVSEELTLQLTYKLNPTLGNGDLYAVRLTRKADPETPLLEGSLDSACSLNLQYFIEQQKKADEALSLIRAFMLEYTKFMESHRYLEEIWEDGMHLTERKLKLTDEEKNALLPKLLSAEKNLKEQIKNLGIEVPYANLRQDINNRYSHSDYLLDQKEKDKLSSMFPSPNASIAKLAFFDFEPFYSEIEKTNIINREIVDEVYSHILPNKTDLDTLHKTLSEAIFQEFIASLPPYFTGHNEKRLSTPFGFILNIEFLFYEWRSSFLQKQFIARHYQQDAVLDLLNHQTGEAIPLSKFEQKTGIITQILPNELLEALENHYKEARQDNSVSSSSAYQDMLLLAFHAIGIHLPFFERIAKSIESTISNVQAIYYQDAVRNIPHRLYSRKNQDTKFSELLVEFMKCKLNPDGIEWLFLKTAFQKLGIADDLILKRDNEGFTIKPYIVKNGKETLLADLGYGTSQVLPILMQIAIIAKNHGRKSPIDNPLDYLPSCFILEEPENSLHPNLQSKLADVLVLANKLFNIQFIVETHSEYFIRKLQYLTAIPSASPSAENITYSISYSDRKKKYEKNVNLKISPEDTALYYFYPPEQPRPEGEPQVKRIRILNDGRLDGEFGTGFFDEATKLMMALLTGENLN